MASMVFFSPAFVADGDRVIAEVTERLLASFVREQHFHLEKRACLKVSFGEAGNKTFVPASWMLGATRFLEERKVQSAFIETNVLYRGERMNEHDHVALAERHGFTGLPIIIADGSRGESYEDVAIDGVHFKSCKIARGIVAEKQLVVVSHFKGHRLAGFGGAIKQLAMGCAARGGKLDQHVGTAPLINPLACTRCGVCAEHCPVNAIRMGRLSAVIDKDACVGCAACIAVCPHGAVKINWLAALTNNFSERLVEYALAAQLGKPNLYVTYALNMTRGCDCEPRAMKPVTSDLGVFVSNDPVAIDRAVLDMLREREGKKVFSEKRVFEHAKRVGFGDGKYELRRF